MPPAAIVAGIGAAGGIANTVIQQRGAAGARRAEQKASQSAITYQAANEAKDRAFAYQQWQQREARRSALLGSIGINLPAPPAMPQSPGASSYDAPAPDYSQPVYPAPMSSTRKPLTLGMMAGRPATGQPSVAPPPSLPGADANPVVPPSPYQAGSLGDLARRRY